jgi:2-dehydropantoate 2-reductase
MEQQNKRGFMIKKIGILGAGSIGCYLGGHLYQAGFEVVFVGRQRLQKEIQENGLTISHFTGKQVYIYPDKIQYETSINSLSDCDLILVTVKSQDSESSALELKKILNPKSNIIIVSFQNGVTNARRIGSILTNSIVLAGMVPYNVLSMGGGRFHSGTSGKLMIQEKDRYSDEILSVFKKANLDIESHPEMEGILWGKLIFNLNNAINALAGIPLKEELSNQKFRKILSACMKEALSIMKQSGIKPISLGKMIPWLAPIILSLPDFLFFRVASSMIKIDPQARSSMWEDLEKRRKVEFDFINGEIINLAKAHNLPCPIQIKIKDLIEQAELNKTGSPCYSAEALAGFLNLR